MQSLLSLVLPIYSDETQEAPKITEDAVFSHSLPIEMEIAVNMLQKPLLEYGVLDKASISIIEQGMRYRRKIPYLDQMDYLMYILGKRENGLQIFYRFLKGTKHRYVEHGRIIKQLEHSGNYMTVLAFNEAYLNELTSTPYSVHAMHGLLFTTTTEKLW